MTEQEYNQMKQKQLSESLERINILIKKLRQELASYLHCAKFISQDNLTTEKFKTITSFFGKIN